MKKYKDSMEAYREKDFGLSIVTGFNVEELDDFHYRIEGILDYYPSTGRAKHFQNKRDNEGFIIEWNIKRREDMVNAIKDAKTL